jgi:predicted secreted protein
MATTGVFNGTDLLLKLTDGSSIATSTTIGHSTSCTLTLSNDLPEATTKDSNGFQEVIAGVKSGEISFEGLIAYDDNANPVDFADILIARTAVSWEFGTAETGDAVYSGSGFLSSVEMSAEMESPATYSGSITVNGAITKTTN